MLAVDTNVVVRYLVADDPSQSTAARTLIDGNDVFVCTTVILETEWVLRSVYGFSATHCAKALNDFAGLPTVTLEDPVTVRRALDWVRQRIDFADALHLAKAGDCDAFVSFDRAFLKAVKELPGVKARTP